MKQVIMIKEEEIAIKLELTLKEKIKLFCNKVIYLNIDTCVSSENGRIECEYMPHFSK